MGTGHWAPGWRDEAKLLGLARAGHRLLTHVPRRAARHVGRAAWVPASPEGDCAVTRRAAGFVHLKACSLPGLGREVGPGRRPCRVLSVPGCTHMVAGEVPPRGPGGSQRGGVSLGKENCKARGIVKM